jgi:hypothetical protein
MVTFRASTCDCVLQMTNECTKAGFPTRKGEPTTKNKTALHHIHICTSFLALVREPDERLLVSDWAISIEGANGLPRSYTAGRV